MGRGCGTVEGYAWAAPASSARTSLGAAQRGVRGVRRRQLLEIRLPRARFLQASKVFAEIRRCSRDGLREYAGFDVILCLAALIRGVKYFHRIPYRIARDNTEILAHAIDATLAAAPEATYVYFSSSMVYSPSRIP